MGILEFRIHVQDSSMNTIKGLQDEQDSEIMGILEFRNHVQDISLNTIKGL